LTVLVTNEDHAAPATNTTSLHPPTRSRSPSTKPDTLIATLIIGTRHVDQALIFHLLH
jgi:hypothetical protein